jgi:hypothetical protein
MPSVGVTITEADGQTRSAAFTCVRAAALWLLERLSADDLYRLTTDDLRAVRRRASHREAAERERNGQPAVPEVE